MKQFISSCAILFSVAPCFALGKTPAPVGGRYQIVQPNDVRQDQYLLDTETGRLWRLRCAHRAGTECDLDYWAEEDVAGKNTTEAKINAIAQQLNERDKARASGNPQ